jgi:uncharacterized protein YdeI (YjbR/CyaY-like superfamily)
MKSRNRDLKHPRNTLHLTTRKQWRQWLAKNHKTTKEIWLVYYRNETGKPSIPYEDLVEEALCFGWIDSIIKKLDNDCYARKFTPRTNMTKWSDLNKRRMSRMLKAGLVTKAGQATIEGISLAENKTAKTLKKQTTLEIPDFIRKAFKQDTTVWGNFNALAKSYQRDYILWISSAKREKTRTRRIEESIKLLKNNQKLGLK